MLRFLCNQIYLYSVALGLLRLLSSEFISNHDRQLETAASGFIREAFHFL